MSPLCDEIWEQTDSAAYLCNSQSIVLENLSHGFLKPNILDIKLGTVLYDETASPEKVERMLKTAKATTSLETGVMLTGFQVCFSGLLYDLDTHRVFVV